MNWSDCSRREFIKLSAAGGALTLISPDMLTGQQPVSIKSRGSNLVMVTGGEPEQLVQRVLDELGGMEKFVSKGDKVFLKPNMSWDRPPECAANSNPQMVAEVVKQCLKAGAKEVLIIDRTCNESRRCYRNSKIEKHAREAGAKVGFIIESRFRTVPIPSGKILKSWDFYKDVMDADVFINMPVAKHHGLSRVSMAVKNLMGLVGGNRGKIHNKFPEKIVDLATVLKPDLVILDAYRILLAHGPQGGNLQDVKLVKTVIAGTNQVSVDAVGATLFDLNPMSLEYLVEANKRKLGEIDLGRLNIKKIRLNA